jgi:hypothetical protein
VVQRDCRVLTRFAPAMDDYALQANDKAT